MCGEGKYITHHGHIRAPFPRRKKTALCPLPQKPHTPAFAHFPSGSGISGLPGPLWLGEDGRQHATVLVICIVIKVSMPKFVFVRGQFHPSFRAHPESTSQLSPSSPRSITAPFPMSLWTLSRTRCEHGYTYSPGGFPLSSTLSP